jgi:hypothetical protein
MEKLNRLFLFLHAGLKLFLRLLDAVSRGGPTVHHAIVEVLLIWLLVLEAERLIRSLA